MPLPSSELSSLLKDVKEELSINHGKHDDALRRRVEAAFEIAEAVVNHSLFPGTVVNEQVGPVPVLAYRPVTAVTAATHLNMSVLSWLTFRPSGVLTGVRPGTLVSYSYGQQRPTAAQSQAVVIIAAHLWRTRGGVTSSSLQDPDADELPVPGFGFALPNQARDLLRPPGSSVCVA